MSVHASRILLDVDPCGVWEDDSGACGADAVERLLFVNGWISDLPVCVHHLAEHLAGNLLGAVPA